MFVALSNEDIVWIQRKRIIQSHTTDVWETGDRMDERFYERTRTFHNKQVHLKKLKLTPLIRTSAEFIFYRLALTLQ